jgi:hypothetical protein
VQDLQDRTREYKVSKARFFEVRYVGDRPVHYRQVYMAPTEELIKFSESRRLPNSPGFQITNKKS